MSIGTEAPFNCFASGNHQLILRSHKFLLMLILKLEKSSSIGTADLVEKRKKGTVSLILNSNSNSLWRWYFDNKTVIIWARFKFNRVASLSLQNTTLASGQLITKSQPIVAGRRSCLFSPVILPIILLWKAAKSPKALLASLHTGVCWDQGCWWFWRYSRAAVAAW